MRILAACLCLLVCLPVMAEQEPDDRSMDFPGCYDLNVTRQALAGDNTALQQLDGCAMRCSNCALAVAAISRQANQLEKAVEYYERAVSMGNTSAPLGLIEAYRALEDTVEAFAWSQFHLLSTHDAEEVLAGEAQGTLAFEILLESAAALEGDQIAQGETRAREIIEQWQIKSKCTGLEQVGETFDECSSQWGVTPVRRTPPRYPTEMRTFPPKPGWAVVNLMINREGRVVDVLAVDASHRTFARAAERAARRWRYELHDSQLAQTIRKTYVVEFIIQP